MRSPHLRASAAILVIAALAVSLSGCGSSSDESSSTTTTVSQHSHFEGGEESVEGFGSEARGAEKSAILSAEQGYLSALGEEDFEGACAGLAEDAKRSLAQLASNHSGGCAATLSGLLSPQAPALARKQASGDVTAIRVKADRALVLFGAPGAKLWVFTLQREGGEWKASDLAASVLVPLEGGAPR